MAVVQYTFTHKQYTEQQLWRILVEYEKRAGLGYNLLCFIWTVLTVLCVQFPILPLSSDNISFVSAFYGESAWHITTLFSNEFNLLCFWDYLLLGMLVFSVPGSVNHQWICGRYMGRGIDDQIRRRNGQNYGGIVLHLLQGSSCRWKMEVLATTGNISICLPQALNHI